MSTPSLDSNVELLSHPLSHGGYQHALIWVAELVVLGFATWRFWRFTLSPMVHPDDPNELPYWIPCM